MIRTSLWEPTTPVIRFLGSFLLVSFVILSIDLKVRDNAPDSYVVLLAVVCILLLLMAMGLFIYGTSNYGIRLTDFGVEVYEWSLSPGAVYRREVTWEQMESLEIPGKTGLKSLVFAGNVGCVFNSAQTTAILRDPRYPLYDHLPEDFSRRLGPRN